MKNKFRLSFFGVIIALLLFPSCNNQSNKKIKVGYLPMVSSLSHYVAQKNGYYKEEGIDVEASPIKTSNLIAQDIVVGNIDVAIELSIVPLLKQLEANKSMAKIFSASTITTENGFDGILVKQTSSIKSIRDLSDKRVGVFPGTTAKNTLGEVFKDSFPNMVLPRFIELDPTLHLQSLESDDIDALFTYEPFLTLGIVKNNYVKIAPSIYAMQYSPNPIGVAAINTKWFNENPALAKKILNAIDKAIDYISQHPEKAKQILIDANNYTPDVVDLMNIMPMSKSNQIPREHLDNYLSILKNMREIQDDFNSSQLCIPQAK